MATNLSRFARLESTTFSTHPQILDQLYGIGFTNRFPVCRIANIKDESTLVGCIGQPSVYCTCSLDSVYYMYLMFTEFKNILWEQFQEIFGWLFRLLTETNQMVLLCIVYAHWAYGKHIWSACYFCTHKPRFLKSGTKWPH